MLQTFEPPALKAAPSHYTGGGSIQALEEKLRTFYGMRYALSVSSATAGLLCLGLALNLRRKSFIAPPLTWGGSLASWLLLENSPIFADLDAATLTIDPSTVKERINSCTTAILAVDFLGVPCDMEGLRRIADEFGLWFIADAAQSLGARRNGRPASVDADALVVSFTKGKTIYAGEGGAILTNNPDLYEKLVWYSQHPARQRRDLGLDMTNEFAFNGRIHPIAAEEANRTFESSLESIEARRKACTHLIDGLNASGRTDAIRFGEQRIEPSFFRLSAAWKSCRSEGELSSVMKEQGWDVVIEPFPYCIIYRQPAFIAQFSHLVRRQPHCPIAVPQIRKRFCLTFQNLL